MQNWVFRLGPKDKQTPNMTVLLLQHEEEHKDEREDSKGQKISEGSCDVFNSHKKPTKQFH